MEKNFTQFMNTLRETNLSLRDFVDFPKVVSNVESISIKLNQLNYLIGQEDMAAAVERLWAENPKVFTVLDILVAVRSKDNKKVVDATGEVRQLNDFFESPAQVVTFLDETGLANVLQGKQIKNLVDYVFGVEVGLDSNARKNRGGHIMEHIVAEFFKNNGVVYRQEVGYDEFQLIVEALGVDKKRFDFVVETPGKTYLIETNFYSSGGSKLNEVARSYTDIAPKINAVPGYEFVWITDGMGWQTARTKLKEAYAHIPSVYNLSNLSEFIREIK